MEAHDVVPVSCVRASNPRLFHADRSVSGWINANGKLGTAAAGDVLYVGDDALDLADYLGATYLPGATVLPFDGTKSFGSITFDVTAAVQDAWANRATRGERLQRVLHFTNATDGDGTADRATFLAEDAPGTSLLPFVEVTYGND